ncbi:MAG TPA: hypothetical protein DCP28_26205 [Cytophagales bacterium]|nr:hypothetical protein [Cytophagales bacterium]
MLRSLDHGLSWARVGQNWPEGVQGSFLAEGPEHLLLATDSTGLFLADGDFSTWRQIGAALPTQKVNALHWPQERIYVGLYRAGIYSSSDLGQNWQPLAGLPDPRVHAILATPTHLWVGTDAGLYRQNLHSEQWETIRAGMQVISLQQVDETMLAGTNQGTLISRNAGQHWDLHLEPQAAHNTYLTQEAAYAMNINADVHYTFLSDSIRWQPAQYSPRDSTYVYEMVESGPYLVMSNYHGLHRSVDLGKTWNRVYTPKDGVIFDLIDTPHGLYAALRR